MDAGAPPPLLPTRIVSLPSELQPAKPVIVGTRSHPFQGKRYPGSRCIGVLGHREGSVCDATRSEPIHDGHLNWCIVCDIEIKTMTFKNTGVCSELHRKQRDGEPLSKYRAVAP